MTDELIAANRTISQKRAQLELVRTRERAELQALRPSSTLERPRQLYEGPCPEPGCTGQHARVFQVGGIRIATCEECKGRKERIEAEKLEQERADAEAVWPSWRRAGVPNEYRDACWARCVDLREIQQRMPSKDKRGAGFWYAVTDSDAAVFKAVREFQWKTRSVLVLAGTTGNGKSHLAAAAAIESTRAGRSVCWVSERAIAVDWSASFGTPQRQRADELVEQASSLPRIVWDDFAFSLRKSPDLLRNILGLRYERGLSSIITTNLSLDDIKRYLDDPPTYGRLCQMIADGGGWQWYTAPDVRRMP